MHVKYQVDKISSLTGKVISGSLYFKNIHLALHRTNKTVEIELHRSPP